MLVEGPVPPDDSAQEWSTTAWPFSARLIGPPLNDGPTAALIGRKREFISAAAATAAPAPPPWARIEIAVNWADPAKTIADMITAAMSEKPASSARIPNDAARMPPATANGAPTRSPSRNPRLWASVFRSRRSSCRTRHSRSSAT